MDTTIVAVRHADAVNVEKGGDDFQRQLTTEGRNTQHLVALFLKQKGLLADYIFVSPLLRAQQTAAILAAVVGGEMITEPALSPSFDEEKLLSHLIEGKVNYLVGHQPTLGSFVNRLVGKEVLPAGLYKSEAAVVRFHGSLSWGQGEWVDSYRIS